MTLREIDKPSPIPSPILRVVTYGSNTRVRREEGMPEPLSRTSSITRVPFFTIEKSTRPSWPAARALFVQRLTSTWRSMSRSTQTTASPPPSSSRSDGHALPNVVQNSSTSCPSDSRRSTGLPMPPNEENSRVNRASRSSSSATLSCAAISSSFSFPSGAPRRARSEKRSSSSRAAVSGPLISCACRRAVSCSVVTRARYSARSRSCARR
jgi:hypothetical protein